MGLTDLAARTLSASGLAAVARNCHRNRLLVVSYHSVISLEEPASPRFRFLYRNSVPSEQFKAHMTHLKRHYTVLGPGDLAALRKRQLPSRSAIVTLDDALLNNYTVAAPILLDLMLPAFFFAPTGFVDAASEGVVRMAWTEEVSLRILASNFSLQETSAKLVDILPGQRVDDYRDLTWDRLLRVLLHVLKQHPESERRKRLKEIRSGFPANPDPGAVPSDPAGNSLLATMTWSQLRRLAQEGMGIGSHTENHTILSRLSEREADIEISVGMRRIAEEVQPDYRVFAYPNGRLADFRPSDVAVLEREGCEAAFTQVEGLNLPDQHPLLLKRINIGYCPLPVFAAMTSGLHPRMLRTSLPSRAAQSHAGAGAQ